MIDSYLTDPDENPAGIHLPLERLPGHTSRGRLERILRRGEFAVTTELNPPDSADPEDVYNRAKIFDGWVDGINAVDASGANCHMSSVGICALLTRMGAHDALMVWEERRMRKEVRATANRLANFDDANLRRSAQAAVAAGARVERALEILGEDVPEHLRYAGELRVAHKQASLDELGRLADPPMTKDAIAGRIRRLLAMADKRAAELGIPGTEASVTPEMLDQ